MIYDGLEYLKRARLTTILDNLIAQQRIKPLAAAFVYHGGPTRFLEYSCSDVTLLFLREKVIPLASQHLNLIDVGEYPGAYAVMGASMGGLMAMYTGFRLPHVFGSVLSQSGAFFPGYVLEALVGCSDHLPLKLWMDVGRFESLLEVNRNFRALLSAQGYQVPLREYPGGHNYTAWRDDLADGLVYLFGREASS